MYLVVAFALYFGIMYLVESAKEKEKQKRSAKAHEMTRQMLALEQHRMQHRTDFNKLHQSFSQLRKNADSRNTQLLAIHKLFPPHECPIDEISLITIPDFSITYHESLDFTQLKAQIEQLQADISAVPFAYDELLVRFTQSISEHSVTLSSNIDFVSFSDAFIKTNPWVALAPSYISIRARAHSYLDGANLPPQVLAHLAINTTQDPNSLYPFGYHQYLLLNASLKSFQRDFSPLTFPSPILNTFILYLAFEKYLLNTINLNFMNRYPNLPELTDSSTVESLLSVFFSVYPSEKLSDSFKSTLFFWLVSLNLCNLDNFIGDFQYFTHYYDKLSQAPAKPKLDMDKATKLKLKKELMYYLSKRR